MVENNANYKTSKDEGWICEPVALARQSLWESNKRQVRFFRSLPGQIIMAVWLFCILRGLLTWLLIERGILMPLVNNGTISMELLTPIDAYTTIVILAGYIIYMRFAERRSFPAMGFIRKNWLLRYLAGLCFGFLIFSVTVLISVALSGGSIVFRGTITPGMFLLTFGGWMIQGMAEEIGYRGYFFLSMSRKHKMYIGFLCSSLFFGATHAFNSGTTVLSIVNTMLIGFVFCLLFIISENIWFVGAFHTAWNLAQGSIFGISVSGHEVSPSIFAVQIPQDNQLLSGGAYGIEANIITTLVTLGILIGSLFIIRKRRK